MKLESPVVDALAVAIGRSEGAAAAAIGEVGVEEEEVD